MAGIVLVTKPSFIFQDIEDVLLKSSWIKANATKDWRDQYEKNIFFLFDLKSKWISKMISLNIYQPYNTTSFLANVILFLYFFGNFE